MSIHALVFFRTMTIFLKKSANRYPFLVIYMKVIAGVPSNTLLFDPMHTDELLTFLFVNMVGKTRVKCRQLIDA